MIGRVVTALAGRSLARQLGGAGAGRLGTAVGIVVPMLLPRAAALLGPWGLVGAAAGAWALNRALRPAAGPPAAEVPVVTAPAVTAPVVVRQPIVTPAPIPMVMAADY